MHMYTILIASRPFTFIYCYVIITHFNAFFFAKLYMIVFCCCFFDMHPMYSIYSSDLSQNCIHEIKNSLPDYVNCCVLATLEIYWCVHRCHIISTCTCIMLFLSLSLSLSLASLYITACAAVANYNDKMELTIYNNYWST